MEVGKIRKENRTRREERRKERGRNRRTEYNRWEKEEEKGEGKREYKRIEEKDLFNKTKKENIHLYIASSFGNTPEPQMRVKLSHE